METIDLCPTKLLHEQVQSDEGKGRNIDLACKLYSHTISNETSHTHCIARDSLDHGEGLDNLQVPLAAQDVLKVMFKEHADKEESKSVAVSACFMCI